MLNQNSEVKIMNEPANIEIDIDYEHMDDLPLTDHIEWNHLQVEKIIDDDMENDQNDWLTA